jgi:formylglycine-generating enzyme required for sulfatase activity
MSRLGMTGVTRLVSVLAISVAIGAAWMSRGPEPSYLPMMVPHPIVVEPNRAIWVQKYEISVAEWHVCHVAGGCSLKLTWQPDQDPAEIPASGLSHVDAMQFIAWLNADTGQDFRLPTLAEWLALAEEVMPKTPDPIFTDPNLSWASAYLLEAQVSRSLKPRGSFATTTAGVTDLDGSVWEWTQDCYSGTKDVSDMVRCPAFFVAGEHVAAVPFLERDPARGGCALGTPPAHLGMRLVRDVG